jgi:hypothetical protein
MLSPDPVTQSPENGQNYNRYTYAFNNPLRYTDPTGYQVDELINGQEDGGEDPAGGYNIVVGVDYPNVGSCGHQSQGGPCNDLDNYFDYIMGDYDYLISGRGSSGYSADFSNGLDSGGHLITQQANKGSPQTEAGDTLSGDDTPGEGRRRGPNNSNGLSGSEQLQLTLGVGEVLIGAATCMPSAGLTCAAIALGIRDIVEATTGADVVAGTVEFITGSEQTGQVSAVMFDIGILATGTVGFGRGILIGVGEGSSSFLIYGSAVTNFGGTVDIVNDVTVIAE